MKLLAVLLSLAFVFKANAGLITEVTTTDDQVILDFSVDDFQLGTGQIIAEYLFDDNQLVFDSYTDSDYLNIDLFSLAWGSAGVPVSGLFIVDYLFLIEPLDSSFDLGQVVFNIIDNTTPPDISERFVGAADFNGGSIAIESTLVREVPEPSTLALFSLMGGLLFMRRKQKS